MLYEKNFMSLRHFWNFRKFWNFDNFWVFKWQFWPNGHNYWQFFFLIFNENDILYILVKFETDRMSPRESAKNGRIGAHGLNCIIFFNSEVIFEIYNENYHMKKIFLSLRSFWNFCLLTTWGIFQISPLLGTFGGSHLWLFWKRKSQRVQKNRFWKCAEVRR